MPPCGGHPFVHRSRRERGVGTSKSWTRAGALHLDWGRLLWALGLLWLVVGTPATDLWLVLDLGLGLVGCLVVSRAFPRVRLHLRTPLPESMCSSRPP